MILSQYPRAFWKEKPLATKACIVLKQSDLKGALPLSKWVIYRYDQRQVNTKLNHFQSRELFVCIHRQSAASFKALILLIHLTSKEKQEYKTINAIVYLRKKKLIKRTARTMLGYPPQKIEELNALFPILWKACNRTLHPNACSRQHVRRHGKMDLITFRHISKIDMEE